MARALILAAATLFWSGLLEGAARLWVARRGDALDKTMVLLRADARFGWAQREDWRGTFMGQRMATNEAGFRSPPLAAAAAGEPRVLVLGPSSAMGWGVPEEATYARRLETLLRARGAAGAAVVNAGEIGYSAWQGLAAYRAGPLRALKPQVVVLAYGANDPDLHRFFFDGPLTDAQALGPGRPRPAVAVQNALRRLLLLHLGARAALRGRDRLACGRTGAQEWRPAVLRVPTDEFSADLAELVRLARADGALPVLMTTAFRFPQGARSAAAARRAAGDALAEGAARMAAASPSEAARAFSRALDADPADCAARRGLAAALSADGDCAGSRAAERDALRCEPARLGRDLADYNEVVRALARRERVPLLDAQRLLADDAAAELLDPIHPSDRGHSRLADALAKLLEEQWLMKNGTR